MKSCAAAAVILLVLVLLLAPGAFAQPSEGSVAGTGTIALKRVPESLRMELTLTADGKDAREAVAKLKQLQSAAKAKLIAAGTSESSFQPGDPRTAGNSDPNQQQQIQRMVRMRMQQQQGAGGKPTTAPAAPAVTVAATLKCEWPLNARTVEEALVAASAIQEKVKAAAIGQKQAATPEEKEELEEMQGNSEFGQAPPGTPTFLYVAKVNDADRAKATADAFAKARSDAAALAKAAGADLGALRKLSSQAMPDVDESDGGYNAAYRRYMYASMRNRGDESAGVDASEAVGLQPGNVSLNLTVSATFALK